MCLSVPSRQGDPLQLGQGLPLLDLIQLSVPSSRGEPLQPIMLGSSLVFLPSFSPLEPGQASATRALAEQSRHPKIFQSPQAESSLCNRQPRQTVTPLSLSFSPLKPGQASATALNWRDSCASRALSVPSSRVKPLQPRRLSP